MADERVNRTLRRYWLVAWALIVAVASFIGARSWGAGGALGMVLLVLAANFVGYAQCDVRKPYGKSPKPRGDDLYPRVQSQDGHDG